MRFKMKPRAGAHYLHEAGGNRRKLKPGDVINVEKHRLGNALDKFEQLDPDPPEEFPEPKKPLVVVVREDGKGYDVVNTETGNEVNTEPLSEEEARLLAGADVAPKEEEPAQPDG